MSNDEKELLTSIEIGLDAEAFKRSTFGKAIIAKAQQYADEATEKLKHVDCTNCVQIRDLQSKVWRGEAFEQFIDELIVEGFQAEEILRPFAPSE